MADYNEQFLKDTIQVWQPHSPEPLTLEDAREIADNMAELFNCLDQLNKKYASEKADV